MDAEFYVEPPAEAHEERDVVELHASSSWVDRCANGLGRASNEGTEWRRDGLGTGTIGWLCDLRPERWQKVRATRWRLPDQWSSFRGGAAAGYNSCRRWICEMWYDSMTIVCSSGILVGMEVVTVDGDFIL